MCKTGGGQNSQASEVKKKKKINTIKTSNKLNLFLPQNELQIQKAPSKVCVVQQTPAQTSSLAEMETVGRAGAARLMTGGQARSAPRFDGSSLYAICSFMIVESSLSMSL